MAGKVKEILNEFVRTRLEARKVHGERGWGKNLGRGKDDRDIRRR